MERVHKDGQLSKSPFQFSRTWEDHRLVSTALKIQPQDLVLCITSSGDNILNLLLDEPRQIVAVDLLAAENALLEFKIAAIKNLTYEEFLIILGDKEDTPQMRGWLFEKIREHLPTYSQKYISHENVKSGISTSGEFQDDTIHLFQDDISKFVDDNDLDNFFLSPTLKDQAVAFQQISSGVENAIQLRLTREHMLTTGWKEELVLDIEKVHGSITKHFLKHFRRVCLTLPAKDNFYLSWWMRGLRGFSPDAYPMLAPAFMQRENFHRLKKLIGRIKIHTATIQDYLMQDNSAIFNKVYLSNILDRVDLKTTQTILAAVADSIVPGGRLAYCTLREPNKVHAPSYGIPVKITHLKELSAELQKKDRMIMYSGFHVFTVKD